MCWGRSGSFHFMASGMLFEFDARNHAVVHLLVIGTIRVFPLARVPLFKLQKQGATGVDTKMWALLRSQGANSDSVSIKWFGTGTSCHVQAEASHQTEVNLMGLGPVLLLPIARVRLLKL